MKIKSNKSTIKQFTTHSTEQFTTHSTQQFTTHSTQQFTNHFLRHLLPLTTTIFCLLLFFTQPLTANNFDTAPAVYKGRFRPIKAYILFKTTDPDSTETATQIPNIPALPSRSHPGEWLPLSTLATSQSNKTLYPDPLYQNMQQSYQKQDWETLGDQLIEGYTQIAGTPYLKAAGKSLYYPTLIQLKAETFYYSFPWIPAAIALYSIALLALILKLPLQTLAIASAFALHTAILALRCYILQRPPVSNMFETVIYVPWIAVLGSFFLSYWYKTRSLLIASSLVSLILLIVLHLTKLNSGLENVQAVLDSQFWLIIHVLMVVGSYGLFALSGVLGHFYLIANAFTNRYPVETGNGTKIDIENKIGCKIENKTDPETPQMRHLAQLILHSMYLGTALLIPGTILGGIWAAQSWGRFWDWDPKESWAFISSCIYLIWIHAYRYGHIRNFGLAVGSITGLMAISFTWYGVNYILGTGLHTYGFGSGGEIYYYLYLGIETLFLTFMVLKNRAKFQSLKTP